MLRFIGRICYVLAGASVLISLGTQYKMGKALFTGKKPAIWDRAKDASSERMSIFVGLWAPTFAIAGKVLEDMGREQEIKTRQNGSGSPQMTTSQVASPVR